jgi:hypothetical protein
MTLVLRILIDLLSGLWSSTSDLQSSWLRSISTNSRTYFASLGGARPHITAKSLHVKSMRGRRQGLFLRIVEGLGLTWWRPPGGPLVERLEGGGKYPSYPPPCTRINPTTSALKSHNRFAVCDTDSALLNFFPLLTILFHSLRHTSVAEYCSSLFLAPTRPVRVRLWRCGQIFMHAKSITAPNVPETFHAYMHATDKLEASNNRK